MSQPSLHPAAFLNTKFSSMTRLSMIYQNTKDCKLYDEIKFISDNESEEDEQDFNNINCVRKSVHNKKQFSNACENKSLKEK